MHFAFISPGCFASVVCQHVQRFCIVTDWNLSGDQIWKPLLLHQPRPGSTRS